MMSEQVLSQTPFEAEGGNYSPYRALDAALATVGPLAPSCYLRVRLRVRSRDLASDPERSRAIRLAPGDG